MATGGTRPLDATFTKFYKCHPTTQVGAVVCILYESVFHTKEIVTKYNVGYSVKFISNTLIICQDHANAALTSNFLYGTLSVEAKELIAQVKLITKEQIKQEIISEIDLEKGKDKRLNETIYEDYNETQSLRIKIELLKQFNSELQDKNRILNELHTKEKQGNNNNNNKIKTFAEITANVEPKSKRIPKLIIKKNNNKDTIDIEKIVMQQLTLNKTIQTKSVACKNNDTVIINCTNEDSINAIENTLNNLLKSDIKIEKEQINKSKLKVINIDKTCSWCNGDHITSKGTRKITKCPNCVFSNEKFKTNYNINHCAIDSDLCEILKSKIKKYIEMTDYHVQPTCELTIDNTKKSKKCKQRFDRLTALIHSSDPSYIVMCLCV